MSSTFYVLDVKGDPNNVDVRFLVQAKNLILPGQSTPVPDPNGGVFIPTSASNPTLTTPTIFNVDGTVAADQSPSQFLIVPANYNVSNSIALAHELDSNVVGTAPIPTDALSEFTQTSLAVAETVLPGVMNDLINNFAAGGHPDLQRISTASEWAAIRSSATTLMHRMAYVDSKQ
jgi:hypothetical protein